MKWGRASNTGAPPCAGIPSRAQVSRASERKWGHSPIPSKWGQTSFGCEGCRLQLRGLTPFAREAGNWGMSPFPFWRSLALGCAALSCQRFVSGHTDRARLNEPPRSTCRASPRAAPLEFELDGIPARTGALEIEPRPLLLANQECPHYACATAGRRYLWRYTRSTAHGMKKGCRPLQPEHQRGAVQGPLHRYEVLL